MAKTTPNLAHLETLALTLHAGDVVILKAPVRWGSDQWQKIARMVGAWLHQSGAPHVLVGVIPLEWSIDVIPEAVMNQHGWYRRQKGDPT